VWKFTKGIPKTHGPGKTDQTGMLDTTRYTYLSEFNAIAPPPEKQKKLNSLNILTHSSIKSKFI
jgi:hypothetical protein